MSITRRVVYVLVLLTLMITVSIRIGYAQGDFPDSDGDTIPDEFDGCPNEAGLPENAGCPAGVVPPDRDGDGQPDVYDGCPDTPGAIDMGGCPDSDGDQMPDNSDACPQQAGISQNSGCPFGVVPDLDGDGISDREDACFDRPGESVNAGCPPDMLTDFDNDNVVDLVDACYDQPGSTGNAGCPDGVSPDFDRDTVPDTQDQCPRIFGSVDNGGCMIDADNDYLEDAYDACPNEPGDARNNGCPEGVAAPDTDSDGSLDIYDRCPAEAGANGLDCPDTDGDFVSDIDDLCPAEVGDPALRGCAAVEQTTLPQNRAVLNAGNITQVAQLGELRLALSEIVMAQNGTMVVQTWNSGLKVYDLNNPALSPSPLESQGGLPAISANGAILVDTLYDPQANVPAIQVWDVATSAGLHYFLVQGDPVLNGVAVSPDGSRFATSHGYVSFFGEPVPEGENLVRLWDVASGTQSGSLSHASGVSQIVFSPDGSRLAASSGEQVFIWDVASSQQLGTLAVAPTFTGRVLAFSPDGSRLAVGQMGGNVSVWDMNSFTELYNVQAITQGQFSTAVLAVAFSPDGTMLAVSGGPFVDGPQLPEFNNQVVILDASTGNVLHRLENLLGIPRGAAFSPDGTLLVFDNSTTLVFWGIPQ